MPGVAGVKKQPVARLCSELMGYVPLRRHENGAIMVPGESQERLGEEVTSFCDPQPPKWGYSHSRYIPRYAHTTLSIVIFPGRLIVQ